MGIEAEKNTKLASYCRALGNLSRVTIFQKIAENPACVTEDLSGLNIGYSVVGQHLLGLKRAGFIKGRITRSKACYCIDIEKLEEFKRLVDDLYHKVKEQQTLPCTK